ncbi:Sensor histidine kinase RcsC [Candidatus Magnetaquicoccaceae bacterium FCR-1]|uniref:histidine kinase n=1 Tax=Candidatus Magnetaquiglobus chichijimensis TaxID=3141448 RepID=A0ABQ0CDC3_9PROT
MPSLHHLTMAQRIAAGFSVLIALLFVQFALFDHQNRQLQEIQQRMVEHPFKVNGAVQKLDKEVREIRYASVLLLTFQNKEEIQRTETRLQATWNNLQGQLGIIEARFLGDMERVRETRGLLESWWHMLLHREIELLLEGRSREAAALHEEEAYRRRLARIEENIHYITEFSYNKAFLFSQEYEQSVAAARRVVIGFFLFIVALGLFVAIQATRAITRPLRALNQAVTNLAEKRFSTAVPGTERQDEFGALARSIGVLQEMARRTDEETWIKSEVNALSTHLQQRTDTESFAGQLAHRLTPLLEGRHGACYLFDEGRRVLELKGGYGLDEATLTRTTIRIGENLVGLCAQKRQVLTLTELPEGYVKIGSGLGDATPRGLLLAPLVFQDRILGVVEVASFLAFTSRHHALLETLLPVIAINLESLNRHRRTTELLEESRHQQALLRQSEEELRVINEELRVKSDDLERQAMELRHSEEEMRVQGEELLSANEELRGKHNELERHARELHAARELAELNAREVEKASRYKSEFLANMSHELRTPLNSLLILARSLASNPEGNMNEDQRESAQIIHDSGTDLLRLINDILDLSKVESGTIEIVEEPLFPTQLVARLERRFQPLAQEKRLELGMHILPGVPVALLTDSNKLERILINLLANAIKFTETGRVSLTISSAVQPGAREADQRIVMVVRDTGIGIPTGMEERIFQAFQQVDGSTSRRHGGTGLGLSIARELARLLGGEIQVESSEAVGSTFTLTLPLREAVVTGEEPVAPVEPPGVSAPPPVRGDEKKVLIIDDDAVFANILANLAREKGFATRVVASGEEGVDAVARLRPDGVILDIGLPGMDGWAVLKRLKEDAATRDIPVHVISGRDERRHGLDEGAEAFWIKPVSQAQIETVLGRIARSQGGLLQPRHVLVIEDDPRTRKAIAKLLETREVKATLVGRAEEALERLKQERFCCMVLDLNLGGVSGFDLLERAQTDGMDLPPVIIHSGRELTDRETLHLREFTDHIIIKGERSAERLQSEVSLFLHEVFCGGEKSLPPAQPVKSAIDHDPVLSGKCVLIVDDDMRNIFALSKALRARGLQVLMAQDGLRALNQLRENSAIDLVIMDIMMPEMDGYAAMRAIRSNPDWRGLPIIALTARAMSGEREKCLEAGASDYLAKPVDLDRLLAMMHRWLASAS